MCGIFSIVFLINFCISNLLKPINNLNIDNKKNTAETPSFIFTFHNTLTDKTVRIDDFSKFESYNQIYMIQIGSYRNWVEAEIMHKKLTSYGLKSTVKKVGEWYRLDIGPIYNQREGNKIQRKLEDNKIFGSLLRQIDEHDIIE